VVAEVQAAQEILVGEVEGVEAQTLVEEAGALLSTYVW
jgi:hypothetical protein